MRSLCCSSMEVHMQGGRILEGQTGTIVNILLLKMEIVFSKWRQLVGT